MTQEIYKAVKAVLIDLYSNKEHYYYITLTADGEANTPCISEWSYEALSRSSDDKEEREELKWSYADSPYCCWKQEKFAKVEKLLLTRKSIKDLSYEAFASEYELRFAAMEAAMQQLDKEGMFAVTQERSDVVVLVEVMPPDDTNTERAYRMNDINSGIFAEWLDEVAEGEN